MRWKWIVGIGVFLVMALMVAVYVLKVMNATLSDKDRNSEI